MQHICSGGQEERTFILVVHHKYTFGVFVSVLQGHESFRPFFGNGSKWQYSNALILKTKCDLHFEIIEDLLEYTLCPPLCVCDHLDMPT